MKLALIDKDSLKGEFIKGLTEIQFLSIFSKDMKFTGEYNVELIVWKTKNNVILS